MTQRTIEPIIRVDWDFDGTFTVEDSRLVSVRGQSRINDLSSFLTSPRGTLDQATLTLHNQDGRYTPFNVVSPLYADITGGGMSQAPISIRVSVNGLPEVTLLRGVIGNPPIDVVSANTGATLEIDARSDDYRALQRKVSTPQTDFATWTDDGITEEELIAEFLKDAGLNDGTGGDFISQAYAAANPPAEATLDPGLFVINWGWMDDESTLEECWLLAAACGGMVYLDRDGVYRYENAQRWVVDDSTPTALDRDSYTGLRYWYDDKDLYDSVTVEIAGRELVEPGVLWEPDDLITLLPGETKTVIARLNQPVYALTSVTYSAITSGGSDITADVTLSRTDYAQRIELEFENTNATSMAILRGVQVQGQAAAGQRGEEVTFSSADSYWTDRTGRNRRLSQNPYMQTLVQAEMVAEFLRDRQQTPRLYARLSGVSDPDIWIGSRVTVDDDGAWPAARTMRVIGVDWTLTQAGFSSDLTCVDEADLYPNHPTPGYFVLGTDAIDGAKVVFY